MSLKENTTIDEGRKIGRGPPSFANWFEFYFKGNGDLLLDFQQGVSRSDLYLKNIIIMDLIQSLPKGFIPPQSSTHTHKHMIGLSWVEHTCDFPGTWYGICLVYAHFWMAHCPFPPLPSKYLTFGKQKNTPRQTTKDAAIKSFQQALAKPRSVCVRLQPVHSSSKEM